MNPRFATDIAIYAIQNPTVRTQQVRVAAACRARGLRVAFWVDSVDGNPEWICREYEIADVPIRVLRSTVWRRGPFAYPSAPALLRLGRSVSGCLRGWRPQVLLTHVDASGIYRVLQHWAHQESVTGVVLQEGVAARTRPGWHPRSRRPLRSAASRLFRWCAPRLLENSLNGEYAHHALVWGDYTRRRLLQSGRAADSIWITGNPGYDHVRGRKPLAARDLRTVLFAQQDQPNRETEWAACQHVVRTCVDILRCRLLVRPHPRGRLQAPQVRELAAQTSRPDLVELASEGELTDHLRRASVLLTYYSASAYEAAMQGVPVVLVEWVSEGYYLDAPEWGAAVSVTRPEDLPGGLGRTLDDEACRQGLQRGADAWLRDHLGELDGRAAERVADILVRLIDAQGRRLKS